MKLHVISLLAASSFATTAVYAQNAQVNFSNGDSLKGEVVDFSKNEILFKHPVFKTPNKTQSIDVSKISSLEFLGGSKKAAVKNAEAHVSMVPRFIKSLAHDLYQGKIQSINKKHVILNTDYAGELKINKQFIEKLDIYNNNEVVFNGVGKLADWKRNPTNAHILDQDNMIHFPKSTGGRSRSIFQKVEFPESYRLDFEVIRPSIISYNSFNLGLYSTETGSTYGKTSCLVLSVNYSEIRARLEGQTVRATIASHRFQGDLARKSKIWKCSIFVNTKKKTISVYFNNKLCIDNVEMANFDPKKLGKHLTFYASGSYGLTLKSLTLSKWNGSKPAPSIDDRVSLTQQKGELIRLQNGDIIVGSIKRITDGIAIVETKYGEFKIKLDNISSLDIGLDEEQEIRMNQNDAQIECTDGSRFIIKVVDIKDGKLVGSSQAFEDTIEFDLKKVKSIRFQSVIYQ